MPFHVCFTGDATHHRDDMISIAMGAKGVYYKDLDRAVLDSRKTTCPVFLVVGGRGASSAKIAYAKKAGDRVKIMTHIDFLELEDINESADRLFNMQAVTSTPRAHAPAPARPSLVLTHRALCTSRRAGERFT
jgi:hypothetical protein